MTQRPLESSFIDQRVVLASILDNIRQPLSEWYAGIVSVGEVALRHWGITNEQVLDSIVRLMHSGILIEVNEEVIERRKRTFIEQLAINPYLTPYKNVRVPVGAIDISDQGVPLLKQVLENKNEWLADEFRFSRTEVLNSEKDDYRLHIRCWTTSLDLLKHDETHAMQGEAIAVGLLKDHWWREPRKGYLAEWRENL